MADRRGRGRQSLKIIAIVMKIIVDQDPFNQVYNDGEDKGA